MRADTQLLIPGSRPAASSQLSAGSSLPADLLEQASRRLGIMCLVIAGLWVANFVVWHFVQAPPTKMPDTAILRLFDRLVSNVTSQSRHIP